jgi:hypothetical protein
MLLLHIHAALLRSTSQPRTWQVQACSESPEGFHKAVQGRWQGNQVTLLLHMHIVLFPNQHKTPQLRTWQVQARSE